MQKRMKIKVCGLTRLRDALLASDLGAWALGFICYEKSPRNIELSRLEELLANLKEQRRQLPLSVGVFVNESIETISRYVEVAKLDVVQLHGDESLEFARSVKLNTGAKVIKAFRLKSADQIEEALSYDELDYLLVDAFSKQAYGGTGELANWTLAKSLAEKSDRCILAGGIESANLCKAWKYVNPYAVDLSSSLEESAGVKQKRKLEELFLEAKECI